MSAPFILRPIATSLLMTAVLMFVSDPADPWSLVGRYVQAMAPGRRAALHAGHSVGAFSTAGGGAFRDTDADDRGFATGTAAEGGLALAGETDGWEGRGGAAAAAATGCRAATGPTVNGF